MLRYVLSLSALLAMGFCAIPASAQPAARPPAPPTGDEAAADPFTPPAGNDSKVLMLYLQRLAQTPPAVQSPEGAREHLTKVDQAVADILSRQLDEEFYTQAAELRLSVLSVLGQLGDPAAADKLQKLLDQLKQDKRPLVQKFLARAEMSSRISQIQDLPPEERTKVIAELTNLIKTTPKEDEDGLTWAVRSALETAQQLERFDTANSLAAYESIMAALKSRNDERFNNLINILAPAIRRLSLPGKPIEIAGKTLDGEDFNIKQYAGKVVLVDFWATWCGPCIQELPHVKEMYEAYHEKGFEVVGISLDEEKKENLERFLDDRDIDWVNLFDTDPEKQGWSNPIVQYYGITGIPTAILVDQKGLVVSLNARGSELTEQLQKLLGDPIKDDEAPANPK